MNYKKSFLLTNRKQCHCSDDDLAEVIQYLIAQFHDPSLPRETRVCLFNKIIRLTDRLTK